MPRKSDTKPSKQTDKAKSVNKYSPEIVREFLAKDLKFQGQPNTMLEQLVEIIPDAQQGKNMKRYDELLQASTQIVNLENHMLLFKTTTESYRTFAIEFADRLIVEYDCNSPDEKALVQLITSAYIRALQYAEMLSINTSGGGKPITHERNNYYNFLSKEVDRAQRQYITGLQTLKQLKLPNLPVTIKTNNAYIAENQQVNNAALPIEHEINKTK